MYQVRFPTGHYFKQDLEDGEKMRRQEHRVMGNRKGLMQVPNSSQEKGRD